MAYSTTFRDEVREKADIVQIVSQYVALTRKGNRYWGCCPFHNEKTPSFTVDGEKGFYKCFGCGAGGDVFRFLMEMEHRSFTDVLHMLAERYGVALPEAEELSPYVKQKLRRAEEIYTANGLAAQYYHSCLVNTHMGEEALNYLTGRGITREIIDRFTLGYAPDSYTKMQSALMERKGVSAATLLEANLTAKGEYGMYDRFRHRVMIPISNGRGKVVGFGGRVLDKSEPKYLNTAETAYFAKRKLLFGLDVAAKAIRARAEAIVVEGYMDAISLHAAGIDWAVASLGTAFTQEQAYLLKRLTPEVVFTFDSDNAGQRAAQRALPIARQVGLRAKVLVVPEAKDPDEFVRAQGKEAFLKLLAEAPEALRYQVEEILRQADTTSLTGKLTAISQVLPVLTTSSNDIEVGQYISELSYRLLVDEGQIRSEYMKVSRGSGSRVAPQVTAKGNARGRTVVAERNLLLVLLSKDTAIDLQHKVLSFLATYHFQQAALSEIYQAYTKAQTSGTGVDMTSLMAQLSSEGAGELTSLVTTNLTLEESSALVTESMTYLELSELNDAYAKHKELAVAYEQEGKAEYRQELLACQEIRRKINALS